MSKSPSSDGCIFKEKGIFTFLIRSYRSPSSQWWSSGRASGDVFLAFWTFKRQWAAVREFFSWVKWNRSGWFCLGYRKIIFLFLVIAHDSSNIEYLTSENWHVYLGFKNLHTEENEHGQVPRVILELSGKYWKEWQDSLTHPGWTAILMSQC